MLNNRPVGRPNSPAWWALLAVGAGVMAVVIGCDELPGGSGKLFGAPPSLGPNALPQLGPAGGSPPGPTGVVETTPKDAAKGNTATPTTNPPISSADPGGAPGHGAAHLGTGTPATNPSPPVAVASSPAAQAKVVSINLSPTTLTLYAPPDAGPSSTDYPSTRQFFVQVVHADLSTTDRARWQVIPAQLATVSSGGMITALGPAGTGSVVASSLDGVATASSGLTVFREGGVEATVE